VTQHAHECSGCNQRPRAHGCGASAQANVTFSSRSVGPPA
jgi:hypothetical protein